MQSYQIHQSYNPPNVVTYHYHPNFLSQYKIHSFLPKLKSSSLISLRRLCDDGCKVILDDKQSIVNKNNEEVLRGHRNIQEGLWDMPINSTYEMPPAHPGLCKKRSHHMSNSVQGTMKKKIRQHSKLCTTTHLPITNSELDHEIEKLNYTSNKANVIIRKKQTKIDLANYLHATCLNPPTTTFLRAINNGHFISWPGLNHKLVSKLLPKSMCTYQGHMKSEKQGLKSTKMKLTTTDTQPSSEDQDYFPSTEQPN